MVYRAKCGECKYEWNSRLKVPQSNAQNAQARAYQAPQCRAFDKKALTELVEEARKCQIVGNIAQSMTTGLSLVDGTKITRITTTSGTDELIANLH